MSQRAESIRGISPRAAHRTVYKPLDLYGSCHGAEAAAFHCTKGSSRRTDCPNSTAVTCLLRSSSLHFRAFITTTKQSAPPRRIGSFGLAVGAVCDFSLIIAGQVLTFYTRA